MTGDVPCILDANGVPWHPNLTVKLPVTNAVAIPLAQREVEEKLMRRALAVVKWRDFGELDLGQQEHVARKTAHPEEAK